MGAKAIANVSAMSRSEWLDLRRSGIGGSDAGAIMGMSPYASPLSVYCEKLGLVPNKESNDAMDFGNLMEPVIRDWFRDQCKAEGRDYRVERCTTMWQSEEWPWMLANLDGRIFGEGGPWILEIKTADSRMGKYWGTDRDQEVPDQYYAQVQHYIAVLGYEGAHVVCLLGRRLIRRYVPRNMEFIGNLVAEEKRFWDMVQAQEIPAPTGMDCDSDLMSTLYPGGSDETVNAASLDVAMAQSIELKESIDAMTEERNAITNKIKATLGNAHVGIGTDYKATWSRFDRHDLDEKALKKDLPDIVAKYTKATPSGSLRITEIKKERKEGVA